MKYLKNALLATSLVISTLGMSLTANAGNIIQQDIFADIFFANPNAYGIMAGNAPQLIGSITYANAHADAAGFLDPSPYTTLELTIGSLSLTLADGDSAMFGLPPIAGLDPFDIFSGLDFFEESFLLANGDFLLLDVGPFSTNTLYLEDANFNLLVLADTFLGQANIVPEPSALILMLAGLGLLVRRKVVAK